MMTSGSSVAVALQVFGTLFLILLSFLGMTAWIIRRIDRVADIATDLSTRLSRVEGRLEVLSTSHPPQRAARP